MVDMIAVWNGTRTYIISNRTNPPPASFISTLRALKLTRGEKDQLINKCRIWPGGNQQVAEATVKDINSA
jgi:hypothetical protein